jgi:hypothetical protein
MLTRNRHRPFIRFHLNQLLPWYPVEPQIYEPIAVLYKMGGNISGLLHICRSGGMLAAYHLPYAAIPYPLTTRKSDLIKKIITSCKKQPVTSPSTK